MLAEQSKQQRWRRRFVFGVGTAMTLVIGVSLAMLCWKESERIAASEARTAAEQKAQATERELSDALSKLATMESEEQ